MMFFDFKKVTKRKITHHILMLVLLFLCHTVTADDDKVTVSFNNANILDVIRWASDLTDKNIIVSEAVKSKTVTVIAGEPMSKKEAYETFLSILQVNGLTAVEADGSLKIFLAQDAKSNAIPLIDEGNASQEQIVVRIVKIKNIAATQLLTLLQPLVPQSAAFQVHADTNILLIADTKSNIEKIVSLVEKIDKAGTIDIEVIQLKHASAKDVVTLVTSLVPKIVSAGKDAPTTQAINVAADERSNSILMSGDPVVRAQIKKLIEKIDQPLEGEGNTQVIYLNYADAKDMAEILAKVGGSVISKDKDQKSTTTKEGEASIIASEANNALVITASPAMLNTMKGVIAKLDVRREQVLVEALLVEVNEETGRELGMLGTAQGTNNFTGIKYGGTFDPAGNITVVPGSDPNAVTGVGKIPSSASGAGLLISYFEDGNLMGVLSVLETRSDSNVLSTPTIMALDNEEASILVGENVPFKTGSQDRAGTTTTTTGTTAVSDFVQIQREDIGINLKVKPKINLNDTLTLEIEQKVESISDKAVSNASDIITNKRELKTKAIVKDNEILVLGGLIDNSSQNIETKVPFLGDIPVLGWLFKGTKKSVVKRNLMVFIHPKIMRNIGDDREVTASPYQNMRSLQDFYNKNTDFLTIRDGSPIILNELSPAMIDPETSMVKESASPDVITVKKGELSLPVEEPPVNPAAKENEGKKSGAEIENENTVGSNIAEPEQPVVKTTTIKPKSKKLAVAKPPKPVNPSPVAQPVSPSEITVTSGNIMNDAVDEKTPAPVPDSPAVPVEPAATPTPAASEPTLPAAAPTQ